MANNPILFVDADGLADWPAFGWALLATTGGALEVAAGVAIIGATEGIATPMGVPMVVDGSARTMLGFHNMMAAIMADDAEQYSKLSAPSNLGGVVGAGVDYATGNEDKPLSDVLRDFKKFTSKKIIESMDHFNESRREWLMRAFVGFGEKLKRVHNYKVWKDGNHPIQLESNKFIDEKISYIHNNPVESELVVEPEYYWYSSARDYADKKGLIDLVLIC